MNIDATVKGTSKGLDTDSSTMATSASTGEDDELTLPRASINKMIKEIIPNIRVANESRELILNCCTEFIHLLSSEANDICNQQQKKTINADHVLQALDRLGFSDYRADAEAVLVDCKAVAAKRRRQSTRLENLGIPEEELLRQQQELFAKSSRFSIVALYSHMDRVAASLLGQLMVRGPIDDSGLVSHSSPIFVGIQVPPGLSVPSPSQESVWNLPSTSQYVPIFCLSVFVNSHLILRRVVLLVHVPIYVSIYSYSSSLLKLARVEQAMAEQQQWQHLQAAAQMVTMQQANQDSDQDDDYS
uniref:Protein Dr1 n=1 Tax=Timema bartmani TaxID=61472 RepID=A0A7R9I184_9NEOP|nr:unnamed protein product [Timema bartmani]